jgi:hypothetical protein
VVADEARLVLLVDHLVRLPLSQRAVDVLYRLETDRLRVTTHVQEQLLRLHVHQLSRAGSTKVRFRWCSSLS